LNIDGHSKVIQVRHRDIIDQERLGFLFCR